MCNGRLTLETRFRKKEIDENPFYGIDYGKHEYKKSFDIRLNESMEEASIKLYMASLEYVGPHKLLFVLSIMLARRIGEIHQLKYSHNERRKEIFTKWWTFLREGAEKVRLENSKKNKN